MATITVPRYRPEDLLDITDRPMPELVDGQLVERSMAQKSDAIAARVAFAIFGNVKPHNLGLVNGGQGSYQIFPDDPGKVCIPDVSFTRRERLPSSGPAEGHSRIAPDLVVKVNAPKDAAAGLAAKIADYLSAGVPLIWMLDPGTRTIAVWRNDRTGVWLRQEDTLDGGDVLPGFSCPVAWFFD